MFQVFIKKVKDNLKIVGLVCFILILVTVLLTSKKEKSPFLENSPQEIRVFSLSAIITGIDSDNNFIMVEHPTKGKDIKVMLRSDSEIIRLDLLDNNEGIIEPKPVKISINDLKPGNQAFIESDENIYQRSEFDGVIRIQILP